MLDFQAARWLVKGEVAKQAGNNHPTSIPTGVFKTADGYINIAAAGQKIWERFCGALGAPELIARPEYATGANRSKNRDALNAEIDQHTAKRTSVDWVERFNKAGVPSGPIYAIDQVFADPQVKHLAMAQPVKTKDKIEMTLVGQPVSLSRTPSKLVAPPPALGEHTDAVLKEFGFTPSRSRRCARPKRFERTSVIRDLPLFPRFEDEPMNTLVQTDKMLSRKEGQVGYVIFNNPERRNAVSLEMWEATARILNDFGNDNDVRVVVLTGAGDKAFVSGADISKFENERANEEAIVRYNQTVERANAAIYDYPKPTIAMIRGYCIGGGVGLALCCDLRICSDNSRFARAGRQARPRLPVSRAEEARRRGRHLLRQGDLLHGAPVRRRGGAHHGPRQPRRAGGRARSLCEEIRRHDRRKRAAHHRHHQVHDRRGGQGRVEARPRQERRHGQAVLREQGLYGRPPRLHGKAQAGLHRD